MVAALTILVFLGTFAVLYRGSERGHIVVLSGAALVMAIGTLGGSYSMRMVLDSIYFETLALIFGMSALSSLLARSGVFVYLAAATAGRSQGSAMWVLVMMALVTYAIALITNSLATMAVVVPVTLSVCYRIGLNPVPVMVSEIIAANLGGASTMIGDFPNMILATAGQLHFNDFIAGMMAPCLVLLAVSLLYFEIKLAGWSVSPGAAHPDWQASDDLRAPDVNLRLLRSGLAIFAVTVAALMLAGRVDLRPGWVAFVGGLAAMLLGRFKDDEIFPACGGQDILFFIGLFVMVGALKSVGVLDWLVDWLEGTTAGHSAVRAVLLLWMAAGITLFVGGGTTAAVFAPVAATLQLDGYGDASWWALALGIMAGSSGALSGTTAGALVINQYAWFIKQHPGLTAAIPGGHAFSHGEYMRWGMPLMLIFLGLSTLYVMMAAG
jgi:Na+/H+ antiporter NhaD/arsenite permease-like protein